MDYLLKTHQMCENVGNRPRVALSFSTHDIPLPLYTRKPTDCCNAVVVDRIDVDVEALGLVVVDEELGVVVVEVVVGEEASGVEVVIGVVVVGGGGESGGVVDVNVVEEEEEEVVDRNFLSSSWTVGLLAAQVARAVETTDGLLQTPTYDERSMALESALPPKYPGLCLPEDAEVEVVKAP